MLKRPSSRRKKSSLNEVNPNLVPIIDTMVALISFLLFTTSFLALVHIESPFPQASLKDNEQKLQEKPLQLTLSLREGEAEIWSPFERIEKKVIKDTAPGQPDLKTIHESLIAIKHQFPAETKIIIVPYAGASYETLIAVMDSMRGVEPTDPPLYQKNAAGIDQAIKTLFPDVIFGNLLGEG